jgi:voltage-gated potassium channel
MEQQSLRRRVYQILEPSHTHDNVSRIFDWLLILLIILNTVALMASTVAEIHQQWHRQLWVFEVFSVTIFTIEYLSRIWSCVEAPQNLVFRKPPYTSAVQQRIRYIFTPMAMIDLLAILPFFFGIFITVDLRVLRLFRLTRMIKLGRYSKSVALLSLVIRNEARVLIAAVSVLLIVMVIAATAMYYIEQAYQPEAFASIPAALWWAINTLTTVGYGDVTPITPLGKLFSGIITILGVGIFALPAGILASSLSEQIHIRRDTFKKHVINAISDGALSPHELKRLNQIRDALDLDDAQASILIDLVKDTTNSQPHSDACYCPHCGKKLPQATTEKEENT